MTRDLVADETLVEFGALLLGHTGLGGANTFLSDFAMNLDSSHLMLLCLIGLASLKLR